MKTLMSGGGRTMNNDTGIDYMMSELIHIVRFHIHERFSPKVNLP